MHQNLENLILFDNVVHPEFHSQGLWLNCFNIQRVSKTLKHQASEEKGFCVCMAEVVEGVLICFSHNSFYYL